MLLGEFQALGAGAAKVQADAAGAGAFHKFLVSLKARVYDDNAGCGNRFCGFHDHRETPWNKWKRMKMWMNRNE